MQDGRKLIARALLDCGAQSSFVTSELCNRLKLKGEPSQITGIQQLSLNINSQCRINIKSLTSGFTAKLTYLVMTRIMGCLLNTAVNVAALNMPKNIKLADLTFHTPGDIDILIGSDIFWDLLCVGRLALSKAGSVLQKTRLGWIVGGTIPGPAPRVAQCNLVELQSQLSKFWEIEELTTKRAFCAEERACEGNYVRTTTRDSDSRFVVALPLKGSPDLLGDSRNLAERRLFNLERKLNVNPDLKAMYTDFFNRNASG